MTLRNRIERLFDQPSREINQDEALRNFNEFKFFINKGELRAALPHPGSPTGWRVEQWIKKGILLGFRIGELKDYSTRDGFHFFDKSTFPLKRFSLDDKVRIVPGGSAVRDCTYLAPGVLVMPPVYINIGAFIDEGAMLDSHVLIGSCSQIGKNVHISAATQIGGVLEPVGAMPVIIEDGAFVGGNCGIYEGAVIKKNAVLGSGVVLTRSTPVYDLVNGTILKATDDLPLIIPEGAVVVQGSRTVKTPFAEEHGISMYTPIIIKYRDEKTSASLALENTLR